VVTTRAKTNNATTMDMQSTSYFSQHSNTLIVMSINSANPLALYDKVIAVVLLLSSSPQSKSFVQLPARQKHRSCSLFKEQKNTKRGME
jgi:hypothetical protein